MSKKKGWKGWFSLLVIVGVVIAAMASNPDFNAHKKALKDEYTKQMQAKVQENAGSVSGLLNSMIGGVANSELGNSITDMLAGSLLEYHNYGLFSTTTTTDKNDPKRVTIGIFGMVFPCN